MLRVLRANGATDGDSEVLQLWADAQSQIAIYQNPMTVSRSPSLVWCATFMSLLSCMTEFGCFGGKRCQNTAPAQSKRASAPNKSPEHCACSRGLFENPSERLPQHAFPHVSGWKTHFALNPVLTWGQPKILPKPTQGVGANLLDR